MRTQVFLNAHSTVLPTLMQKTGNKKKNYFASVGSLVELADTARRPHPLQNPPVEVALEGSVAVLEIPVLVGLMLSKELIDSIDDRLFCCCCCCCCWLVLLLSIRRSESNLPLISSSSCLATASAVLAFTSSTRRFSSGAVVASSSLVMKFFRPRPLDRLLDVDLGVAFADGDLGTVLLELLRTSFNSRSPLVGVDPSPPERSLNGDHAVCSGGVFGGLSVVLMDRSSRTIRSRR